MCHAERFSSTMSCTKLASFLAILLLIHGSRQPTQALKVPQPIRGCNIQLPLPDLSNGEAFVRKLNFASSIDLMFNVSGPSTSGSMMLFQIHTYQYNVTLSYDEEGLKKALGRSVYGSNIGLYVARQSNEPFSLYVRNNNLDEVDALIVVTAYDARAPVPGGCNMEFGTEIAPYLKLDMRDDTITIDMQPASLSTLLYPKFSCGRREIEHNVYQMFLPEQDFSPESYFDAIRRMLTVKDILENGRKMAASTRVPMRRVHSAFTGVGSVYVTVSSYKNYTSAYIPAVSYACNPVLYPDSCKILNGVLSRFVCTIALLVGMGMVFLCRKSFIFESCVSLFLFGSVIGYAVAKNYSFSVDMRLLISLVSGIIAVIPEMWHTCSQSQTESMTNTDNEIGSWPRVPTACVAGLLLACSVSLYLPNLILFHGSILYWIFFASLTIVFILIVSCTLIGPSAIIGSTLMVLSIDYVAPSCLKYVIINIIRRAVVNDYNHAIIHPPYQDADIGLTVLWCVLGIIYLFNAVGRNFDSPLGFFSHAYSSVTTRLTGSGVRNRSHPGYSTFGTRAPSAPFHHGF